ELWPSPAGMLDFRHVRGVRDLVEALRDVLALGADQGRHNEQSEDDDGDEKVCRGTIGQRRRRIGGSAGHGCRKCAPRVKYSLGNTEGRRSPAACMRAKTPARINWIGG